MAKNEYALQRVKDTPTLIMWDDGTAWNAPRLGDLLSLPADAVGTGKIGEQVGGLEIVSIQRAYKLLDAETDDGSPAIITCTITFKRQPANEHERERVARAVDIANNRTSASKLRKVEEATEMHARVMSAYRQGAVDLAAKASDHKPTNVVETVRDALALAEVIKGATVKALPASQ